MPTPDQEAPPEAVEEEILPPAPAPDPDAEKNWKKVLIVASGSVPSNEKRPVIIAEERTDEGEHADRTYQKGADLYVGIEDSATFPEGVKMERVGREVAQGGFGGLSRIASELHVGPCHPVYAAINSAYLRGAEEVEVKGLSSHWKERLQPWIDGILEDSFAPAEIKVTLT